MTIKLYGIQKASRTSAPLHRYGRWHSGSAPVRYLAESPALAVLEFLKGKLVILDVPEFRHGEYLLTSLLLDEDPAKVPFVDPAKLPYGWQHIPFRHSRATQMWGDAWLKDGKSLLYRVPSAALPPGMGWVYLVNLAHPGYPNPCPPNRVEAVPFDLPFYLDTHRYSNDS